MRSPRKRSGPEARRPRPISTERGLGAGGEVDGLELEVRLETLGAELAADARALVAAERGAPLHGEPVDGVGAGADAAGDVDAVVDVGRPHRARQAVVAVVGDADGVGLVVVGDDRQHRTEDLLLGDASSCCRRRRRSSARRTSRVSRPAGPAATGGDAGAFGRALGDVALDPIALALGDQRADGALHVGRVADHELGLGLPR